MKQINVECLVKTFNISRRRSGFIGAATGLFHRDYDIIRALDEISFSIGEGEKTAQVTLNW